MAERANRGLIQSLVKNPALSDRERIADVALMTALADSLISESALAQIIRSMLEYVELEGIAPEWMVRRTEELRDNAPLFSEIREQLVRELTDPRMRKLALSIAAKIVGSNRELLEEERAVLYSLAQAFRIPDGERNALLAPWRASIFIGDTLGFNRCEFNAPDLSTDQTIFEAMGAAVTDPEFRLLVHKVSAARHLLTQTFEGGDIDAVGEVLRLGPYGFRIDTLFRHNLHHYIARFLGPAEALHPLEHSLLGMMAHRLDEAVHVLVVHSDDLSSTDRVFLAGLDQNVVRAERLVHSP